MIYEILLPLPINKTFSYEHPDSKNFKNVLSRGSLVEVEFNKKLLVGLVVNISNSEISSRSLKKINKVFNPFFNNEIIKSINFISQYSCNKKSLILKLFLSGFAPRYENIRKINYEQTPQKELLLNSEQLI